MRVVIQRVKEASVTIDGICTASITHGLLVLVGIEDVDDETDVEWLSNKIIQLRIFDDEEQIPNLSLKDIDGELLLVSQFTLFAATKKGNRPGYSRASKPVVALPLYESMIAQLQQMLGKKIATGIFGADMKVALINDGPITIVIDSKNKE